MSTLKIPIKYIFVLTMLLAFTSICSGATSTTWKGTTSSDWNTASNWSNGVPTSALAVTIGGGTYQPTLSVTAAAGTYSCASLTVSGNATLTINSGYTLSVGGIVTINTGATFNVAGSGALSVGGAYNNHGTFSVLGNGALSITGAYNNYGNATFGSGPVTFTSDFTDNTGATATIFGTGLVTFNSPSSSAKLTVIPMDVLVFTNVTFDKGQFNFKSNTGATAGFAVTSTGVMTLTNNASLIFSNTYGLTLRSDANGSATLAPITGTSTISNNGNIHVERFIKGSSGDLSKRGYRLMSSAVNTGTVTNYDATSSKVFDFQYLLNSIYVSGPGNATNGFNVPTTTNPSLYLFREDNPPPPNNSTIFTTYYNWKGVAKINNSSAYNIGTQFWNNHTNTNDTTTTIPVGNGFLMLFRGDKSTTQNYTYPYGSSVQDVTLTESGNLNTGTIKVRPWFSNSGNNLGNNLSYTYSTTALATGSTSALTGGFNLVGNPYPSTINWEKYNNSAASGALTGTVSNTIYEFDELNHQYVPYIATQNSDVTSERLGLYTGSGTNMIASGQGFFVVATGTGQTLTFTENAKVTLAKPTNLTNMMSSPQAVAIATNATASPALVRLRMVLDSNNSDEVLIALKRNTNSKFIPDEDALDLGGNGALESLSVLSSDSVKLAINQTPFPGATREIIPLSVDATASHTFQLTVPELRNVPKLYAVWLKDNFTGDSINLKLTRSYSFTIDKNNPATFGSKRFSVIISQDPAYAYHLLSFTAERLGNSSNVQTHWTTANEENYTNFTVERSTDGGKTFSVVGGMWGTGAGDYALMDKNVPIGTHLYRLKSEDIDNTISYSALATVVITENGNGNSDKLHVYPNPATSVVNLDVLDKTKANTSYNIIVSNSTGFIVKQATSTQPNWQANISDLMPGTYLVRVTNNKTNDFIGESKFIKL